MVYSKSSKQTLKEWKISGVMMMMMMVTIIAIMTTITRTNYFVNKQHKRWQSITLSYAKHQSVLKRRSPK